MEESEEQSELDADCEELIIDNIYQIGESLGSGSFGELRKGVNLLTHECVAIKLEVINEKRRSKSSLEHEYGIYKALGSFKGLPKIYHFGKAGKYFCLVMELLGKSLEDLFVICKNKFSIKTVLQVAIQLIDRLEMLHLKSIISRDIKPENFLIGLPGTPNSNLLHIIDFGLSKKYRDSSKKHIPFREKLPLVGTPRYMSINCHKGSEQSRRDDLESLGYVLIRFLKKELPWQGLQAKSNHEKRDKIKKMKMTISIEELCSDIPEEIVKYLSYVRGLKFEEEPDYEFLRKLFENRLQVEGYTIDGDFDWSGRERIILDDDEIAKQVSSNMKMIESDQKHEFNDCERVMNVQEEKKRCNNLEENKDVIVGNNLEENKDVIVANNLEVEQPQQPLVERKDEQNAEHEAQREKVDEENNDEVVNETENKSPSIEKTIRSKDY